VVRADSGAGGVLRQLADCDSTGVLHVDGPPGGTFRLTGGRVTDVVTDAVPDLTTRLGPFPEQLTPEERRTVARSVLIDAAVALLARPSPVPPRFQAGDAVPVGEWVGAGDRSWGRAVGSGERSVLDAGPEVLVDVDLGVDDLLAQVAERTDRLAGITLEPDDVLVVRPVAAGGRVRLDPVAWQLLSALDRPRSSRVLAWQLALPLVDTVLAVASLLEQGAAEIVRVAPREGRPGPPDPPDELVSPTGPDGPTATGSPSERSAASASPSVAIRSVAVAPVSSSPADIPSVAVAPAASPPAPAQAPAGALPRRRSAGRAAASAWAMALSGAAAQPPDRDLLLRVLDGLRRL
jgi:hypothetical protein